jgi:acetyl-CoA acetyltransferase
VSTAIAGLGITAMGKIYSRTAADFAHEAAEQAVTHTGLTMTDVDGLLVNPGVGNDLDIRLQGRLQLRDLRLLSSVQAFGSSACAMVQMASMAIDAGMCDVVLCVFADAPLKPGTSAGAAYATGSASWCFRV